MNEKINLMTTNDGLEGFEVYTRSRIAQDNSEWMMVRKGSERFLAARGDGRDGLQGEDAGAFKICPLTIENSLALRQKLPHLNPSPISTDVISIGMGDRLGRATVGHLAAIDGTGAMPVLAQQSVRELNLTNRNFPSVLADAVWGVFQYGYTGAFGADGDHLKTRDALEDAIAAGYKMITLDCSEQIRNEIYSLSAADRFERYNKLPEADKSYYRKRYLEQAQSFGAVDEETLLESVLVYADAIRFARDIYEEYLADRPDISFEVSIDETDCATTLFAHAFVATELIERYKVKVISMAPRFVGEFQKGIDYIGDLEEFDEQLLGHQAIAQQWGYKISFHSGSDKFAVFPSAARITGQRYHLKTAGTSWLEFVRQLSHDHTELFHELYNFSLENLENAKKNYHVNVTVDTCPSIDILKPGDYWKLLEDDNARQLLHINYGGILNFEENGELVLKKRLYNILDNEEEAYHQIIRTHFQRHLKSLGLI
ncbi:MAG: tagaturonate epimerase family protein [Saccharofermentanales bacterium]